VALATVSTGLLAGCGDIVNFGSEEAAHAQKKAGDLVRQLEALPGGKVTATIESGLNGGQNNIEARAVLPATATTAQLNVMADTIERTIWLSRVDPLGRIGLIVRRQGGTDPCWRGSTSVPLTRPRWVSSAGLGPTGSPADPILLAALTTAVDAAHRVRSGSTSNPLWAARTWRAAEPETNRHAVGRTQITQPGRAPPRITDRGGILVACRAGVVRVCRGCRTSGFE